MKFRFIISFAILVALNSFGPVESSVAFNLPSSKPIENIKINIEAFNKLFKDTSFTIYHVHELGFNLQRKNKVKGTRINESAFTGLRINEIDSFYSVERYATIRFSIDSLSTGYVIRIINPAGPHTVNSAWLYTYNKRKKRFTKPLLIANSTGEENYFMNRVCWLTDINEDKQTDLVMRTKTEDEGLKTDVITARLWKNLSWQDSVLKNQKELKQKYKSGH